MKTVLETQEAAEAESAQDDDSDLVSLLQEVVEPSSKHNESQDFFSVEEKVHQWPPWFDLSSHTHTQQLD